MYNPKSNKADELELVRNEKYWDAESVALPGVKIIKCEDIYRVLLK